MEQLSLTDYTEQYFISPSFDKYELTSTNKEWEFENDSIVYELLLTKPNFLPLDTKQYINLLQSIAELEWPIFTQVLLCRRLDQWREVAVDMYYAYLDGIDSPISNKTIRNVKTRVLNVLNKVSNYNVKRNEIEEVEQKILQHNYRFECRIILLEPQHQQKFEENMQKLLKKLNLFNEMVLKRVKKSKNLLNLIKNRSFCAEYVNQMLSEKEINSLLGDSEWSTTSYTPTVAPVKKKGITQKLDESMLLQRAIQILPFKESQQREVDQTLPKRINGAFKRVGITDKDLKVSEILVGSSLMKVQMIVPPNLVFTQFKKRIEDIQAALGNTGVSIQIGDKPDTINIYMPLDDRDVIYLRKVLESEEFQQFAKNTPLPFVIGESVDGGLLFGCLTKLRHLLIAGTTGSGKSVFVNNILLCLLLNVPSEDLIMYLVDPKMVEFNMYEGFPQVKEVITEMKKAEELLSKLTIEMDKRYEIMSKVGARDIDTYHQKSDVKMPFIVCCIDELADLMMTNGENVEDYIVRIGQKARGCGIHLILCTQRPSVDVVTGLIKANMPSRFSFKVSAGVDSKTILDTVGAEKLLGLGDGLAKIEGNPRELERFQSPILTLDKRYEEGVYEQLKQLFKDLPSHEHELAEVEPEEEPIDKLKRIIANTEETRLSELQGLMRIKMNTVSHLLKQLAEEGFIEKQGKSWVVIASEEELAKWRDE
jgi:S-DNA-T family DNA segregation ATPase FtsK/SpoIIIE